MTRIAVSRYRLVWAGRGLVNTQELDPVVGFRVTGGRTRDQHRDVPRKVVVV